jgi:hypothetical protein
MSFRLYIVPKIGDGTKANPWRAKYFADNTLSPRPTYSSMDYGFEPWFVVGADLSAPDHSTIAGEPDAFALPTDLDATLTVGQVTSVQNKLEAINVPAGWVNTSLTWRAAVRIVLGMFSFIQRLGALLNAGQTLGVPFFGTVNLSTTISQLSGGTVTALQQAAVDLNLSTTGIVGSTTLRSALKTLADQMDNISFNFNGVLI